VVVFARNTKAAQRIAAQFQAHRVRKTYWAVLAGHLPAASGRWEDWLRKIPEQARTVLASAGEPGAKLAVLDYRVLAYLGQPTATAASGATMTEVGASAATGATTATAAATLVEFTPQTGRMHQLRVQSASRGFPILGDELYGCTRPFGPPAESPRDRWIALHAASICLEHPTQHVPLTITAPLPDYWQALGLPPSLLAPDRAAAIDWPKHG
jgi:23S rRNA pseudouridine1911/1915/1917 synthase